MIDNIVKSCKSSESNYQFSIIIPTWNNLPYLQNCIKSIKQNSVLKIQIIVVVNEGKDGTNEWLDSQKDIDLVSSPINIGICYGLNASRSLIKSDFVIYINDDMYVLPDWDVNILREIKVIGTKNFMFSSTMIEPTDTGNPSVIVKNFGSNLSDFQEDLLLKTYKTFPLRHWSGSTWPPTIVHIDLWDLVGGMSIEYSPGFYSDPDLSRKLFEAGVRTFKGIGDSFVYHFGSKSTKRIKINPGKKVFLLKWGISSKTFTDHFLNRGEDFHKLSDTIALKPMARLKNKIKRLISAW